MFLGGLRLALLGVVTSVAFAGPTSLADTGVHVGGVTYSEKGASADQSTGGCADSLTPEELSQLAGIRSHLVAVANQARADGLSPKAIQALTAAELNRAKIKELGSSARPLRPAETAQLMGSVAAMAAQSGVQQMRPDIDNAMEALQQFIEASKLVSDPGTLWVEGTNLNYFKSQSYPSLILLKRSMKNLVTALIQLRTNAMQKYHLAPAQMAGIDAQIESIRRMALSTAMDENAKAQKQITDQIHATCFLAGLIATGGLGGFALVGGALVDATGAVILTPAAVNAAVAASSLYLGGTVGDLAIDAQKETNGHFDRYFCALGEKLLEKAPEMTWNASIVAVVATLVPPLAPLLAKTKGTQFIAKAAPQVLKAGAVITGGVQVVKGAISVSDLSRKEADANRMAAAELNKGALADPKVVSQYREAAMGYAVAGLAEFLKTILATGETVGGYALLSKEAKGIKDASENAQAAAEVTKDELLLQMSAVTKNFKRALSGKPSASQIQEMKSLLAMMQNYVHSHTKELFSERDIVEFVRMREQIIALLQTGKDGQMASAYAN